MINVRSLIYENDSPVWRYGSGGGDFYRRLAGGSSRDWAECTEFHPDRHLSDYRGKIVVLEWVNPECPFVRKHYESGNIPMQQKAAVAEGVAWLVINSGHPGAQGDYTPNQVKAWQTQTGSAPTAYFRDQDGVVGRLYGAKTTPHMYVITTEGILAYNGAIDSIRSSDPADIAQAEKYVSSAVASVKAGTAVKNAATRPYGCSVKY